MDKKKKDPENKVAHNDTITGYSSIVGNTEIIQTQEYIYLRAGNKSITISNNERAV